jgi:phytoene synthase
MNPLNLSIFVAESHCYCRRLSKVSGSNFLWAFSSLSESKRRAMYALYAFMRFSDDLIDAALTGEEASMSVLDLTAKDRLKQWRSLLKTWLLSDATTAYGTYAMQAAMDDRPIDPILILPALIDTIERYQIPTGLFFTVLDGVEMDLTKNRYRNFKELELYCERVASAVGLACIHIWGFEGRGKPEAETVFELARKVGIAYQLTNILRDVKEDAALDRVYLPLEEISAAGYSVEELKNGVINPAFNRLMRTQLAWAEDYYRASRDLYARLKPEGKKIFGLMTATYHAISKKIAANPAAVFTKHIRPGMFERLRLVAKWTCFTPRELIL